MKRFWLVCLFLELTVLAPFTAYFVKVTLEIPVPPLAEYEEPTWVVQTVHVDYYQGRPYQVVHSYASNNPPPHRIRS